MSGIFQEAKENNTHRNNCGGYSQTTPQLPGTPRKQTKKHFFFLKWERAKEKTKIGPVFFFF
jgi:hypothetical protein